MANPNDIEWWLIQDPGTSSGWAQLFIAYRPYDGIVCALKENLSRKATVSSMYKLELEGMHEFNPKLEDWRNIYDEAAAWFYNERCNLDTINNLQATTKNKWRNAHAKDLPPGVPVIKDMLAHDRLVISENCPHLISELRGYKKAYIQRKSNDHLIDCLRYFVLVANYFVPHEVTMGKDKDFKQLAEKQKEATKSKEFDFGGHLEKEMNGMFLMEALEKWR